MKKTHRLGGSLLSPPLKGEAAKMHKMLHELRSEGAIDAGEGLLTIANISASKGISSRWKSRRNRNR